MAMKMSYPYSTHTLTQVSAYESWPLFSTKMELLFTRLISPYETSWVPTALLPFLHAYHSPPTLSITVHEKKKIHMNKIPVQVYQRRFWVLFSRVTRSRSRVLFTWLQLRLWWIFILSARYSSVVRNSKLQQFTEITWLAFFWLSTTRNVENEVHERGLA